ncbi:hypothetical protein JKG47_07490 [Acidithiobacillus sp. MC6.1]|nr:hypothetical protein [Acidithiobacillus sp. MC6.1]
MKNAGTTPDSAPFAAWTWRDCTQCDRQLLDQMAVQVINETIKGAFDEMEIKVR